MRADSSRRAVPLFVTGIVLVVAGTVASTIDARRPVGMRNISFIAVIAGLFLLAIVVLRSGEDALPERLREAHGRWMPWIAPALAVLVMATLLVSKYGFRSCMDLPVARQCPCYYVAWQRSVRTIESSNVQAARRSDVRAACAADELPPEFQQ